MVGLTCGLRPGELLALARDDGDLDARSLRVERALVRFGGKVAVGTTKTAASRRELRLPARAARALMEHRTRQGAHRAAVGEHWQ
ncbi:MAG: hypothetical protein M3P46_09110 [Actinomycetota bacterium]|nr:hypothetical protein [Actinomycetota bacterium]